MPATTAPDLFPYQNEGASFLAARHSGFLFDEQGLGKTPQAIRAADLIGARRIIVICPASVKENWRREFDRFGAIPRKVDVAYGRAHVFNPTADVAVVNFDLLTHPPIITRLRAIGATLVVIDEAHMLRNNEAKRTQAVFGPQCTGRGGIVEGKRVFALTGTPLPNNPSELWPLLRAITPHTIFAQDGKTPMPKSLFVSTYCTVRKTAYGVRITGGKNIDDLRSRLAGVALRRRKAQVAPQLPPFRAEILPLSATGAKGIAAVVDDPAARDLARRLAGAAGNDEAIADAIRKAGPAMSTNRRLTGIVKAPLVADWVAQELEGGTDKIVVMAIHTDAITTICDTLEARGYRTVRLDGTTSAGARQAAIDGFQNDPGVRVFVGQITAAGTGITLTAASDLVFAELSWVPADNAQAAMRVHRIGQTKPVLVRIATLPGTVDEAVSETLRRKMKAITETLS